VSAPTVCAVMLTRDRPALAAKAVECFLNQTYKARKVGLAVFDTSITPGVWFGGREVCWLSPRKDVREEWRAKTIGDLRNFVPKTLTDCTIDPPDIYIHWDDDDYSHPNRIAEQVAFLQSSGAQAVGYNEMLFADTRITKREAWLFSYSRAFQNKVLGTSLCYWRKTWETKPFPDAPQSRDSAGEDTLWMQGLDVRGQSGFINSASLVEWVEPLMIARIHGANCGSYDIEGQIERGSKEWRRAPEWDARVREILK
jgi:hypothetical protein